MKKTIKKTLVLMMLIGVIIPSTFAIDAAEGDITPNPVTTVSKKTARIGEQITHSVSGLSFQTAVDNPIVDDYRLEFYTEKFNQSYQIDSIHIPSVVAEGADYVEVYFMTIYPGGRHWVVNPIKIYPGESITYTREQIKAWVDANNGGEFSSSMYFMFQPIKDGVHVNTNSLQFSGPVDFTYNIVNGTPYSATNTRGTFQGYTSWAYAKDPANRVETNILASTYFETSDIAVSASKAADLIPGEEIDLTFQVTNPSVMNNLLWLGMESKALELVGENTDLNWSNVTENIFHAPIHIDGAWKTIERGQTYSFTRRFKVKDDYNQEQIVMTPFLHTNGDFTNRETDSNTVLELRQEQKYKILYDLNGGVDELIVDETKYLLNDVVRIQNNTAILENHTFLNWNTSPDGSGTCFEAGKQVLISDIFSAQRVLQEITLYAIWEENPTTGTPDVNEEKPNKVSLKPEIQKGDTKAERRNVNKAVELVKTGDTISLLPFITLAFLSSLSVFYVVNRKKTINKKCHFGHFHFVKMV